MFIIFIRLRVGGIIFCIGPDNVLSQAVLHHHLFDMFKCEAQDTDVTGRNVTDGPSAIFPLQNSVIVSENGILQY